MSVHISSAFDSGRIEVAHQSNPSDIRLRIPFDVGDEHRQWFHFRVSGAKGVPLRLHIDNAGRCSYPKGWEDYRAVVSTDRETWTRTETHYEDGVLTIVLTPEADAVWVAYFAPYSFERLQDLLADCQQSPLAQVDRLGATVDGRDLDRVVVRGGPRVVWVIARQHPGETMASFWMEGFLGRLLDPACPVARQLRSAATFHVVPHMNPDGGVRGHLRCNAAGANLNREWANPTMERSPEVKLVLDAMDETGVDLCLDVHGDEALPYNFIAGPEGVPSYTPRLAGLLDQFLAAYCVASPDFQTRVGYPKDAPGEANLTMCTNQVAERFDCLAMTLEMPFKDNADLPEPVFGWSPERCALLGRAALHPIAAVMGSLR